MRFDLWLAFIGASIAISVSPGAGAIQSMATGLNHGLRRGAWSVAGLQIGSLLTGAVVTETIFSWPGIGRLLIQSIQRRDYPLVQGCVLFIAVVYSVVNAGVDLVVSRLDPRTEGSAASRRGRA